MNSSFKILILCYAIKIYLGRKLYDFSPALVKKFRWWNLKRKHLKHSPFYSQFVRSKKKLEAYPQIDKSEFMAHFDQINTKGVAINDAMPLVMRAEKDRDFSPEINGVTAGMSSGTSGNRGVFLASAKERALWVACVLDRVLGWSLKPRKVAFFLRANSNLYESVGSHLLSFVYFDLLVSVDVHIATLNRLQPDIVVGQPSLLKLLAKSIENGVLVISPHKIISVAEVLTHDDRVYLEKVFKQTLHQVYQCTEGFLASTCKLGVLHFNEDFIHVEKHIVDEERFNPIVTDLFRGTQPVIRYLLNDILVEGPVCACGSSMMTLDRIEGRMDDVFVIKDKSGKKQNVFPDFLRRIVIGAHEDITEYQIIQMSENEISLFIRPVNFHQIVVDSLSAFFNQRNLTDIKITKSPHLDHDKNSKFRRVICKY